MQPRKETPLAFRLLVMSYGLLSDEQGKGHPRLSIHREKAYSGTRVFTIGSWTRNSKYPMPWAKGRPFQASNISWWAGA